MNAAQRAAANPQWRRLLRTLGDDVGTHFSERRDHAIHGPARKRSIANQPALECLASKQTGKQTHGRSGIAAVDLLFRGREHAFFAVDNNHVWLGLLDLDAENAQRIERVHAIVARQKAAQCARAVRQGGDNRGAMRNALITGNGDLGVDSRRSFDP